MDYETPDGSQFWLSEVWTEREDGDADFEYTTISALIDGRAYAGKTQEAMDDVDETQVLQYLETVPAENVFPLFASHFSHAPSELDPTKYYLKGPQFTYDDCQPGRTFVADCLLNEVTVLERLRAHPHPNVVRYHGCVVKDGRITNLCLERCVGSLVEFSDENELTGEAVQKLIAQVRAGIEHLHALGLAHNDINPDNICIDANKNAVIVDFDACLPFGELLMKGEAERTDDGQKSPASDPQNDFRGLSEIEEFLQDCVGSMHA